MFRRETESGLLFSCRNSGRQTVRWVSMQSPRRDTFFAVESTLAAGGVAGAPGGQGLRLCEMGITTTGEDHVVEITGIPQNPDGSPGISECETP